MEEGRPEPAPANGPGKGGGRLRTALLLGAAAGFCLTGLFCLWPVSAMDDWKTALLTFSLLGAALGAFVGYCVREMVRLGRE